jgi:hypothetical protein
MVTIVVLINTMISLLLLYVAWRIWQLRRWLANIANIFIAADRSSYAVLHEAPKAIYKRQENIYKTRLLNQTLQLQIQQLRQIFGLLLLGQQLWRRYFHQLRSESNQK